MQVLRASDPSYKRKLATLNRRPAPDPSVRRTVESILAAIARGGDEALLRLVAKFGGPRLDARQLFVTPAEVAEALRAVPKDVQAALHTARRNVAAFARRSLRRSWFRKNAQGAIVGERFDPFERVGIYIPGGTAPLVSTAVMTCTLAKVAGVREIVATTPCDPHGKVSPAMLGALSACGATEIYRVGGAQAVAAMALGTPTIRPVQKIFGPGNAFVVEAKRQVFGLVAVDLLPGPSELLVIADATARADWVAADLLAQCEHGHGSAGMLVTTDARLIDAVAAALRSQARRLSRGAHLAAAIANIRLVEAPTLTEAISIANAYAAEHVCIATREPGNIAARLTTSGAIFLGGQSPVAAGDFLAGPSHELPTGGAGKCFSGLTTDQFQRRTSIIRYDQAALRASLPTIDALCSVEGLDAHAHSARIRLVSVPKLCTTPGSGHPKPSEPVL